jgi:hypothetical protein
MRAGLLAAGIALAGAVPAHAGVEIQLTSHERGAPAAAAQHGALWTEGTRVRIDAPSDGSPELTVLFDSTNGGRLELVDHHDRSVTPVDRATLDTLTRRARRLREEWQARLANVAPEQRAALERMAGGLMDGVAGPPAPLRLEPGPERRLLRGAPVRQGALLRGDARVGEVWLASWQDAGVTRLELRALHDLGAFARDLAEALGSASPLVRAHRPLGLFAEAVDLFDAADAFPLAVTALGGDAQAVETDFTRVERRALEPALFREPEGYTQLPPEAFATRGLTAPGKHR